MTVSQLIKHLSRFNGNERIVTVDASCIVQPMDSRPQPYTITEDDANNHGDLDGREGEVVVCFSLD